MKNKEIIDGLVSVIMPSWNTSDYISEAIMSVMNQSYKNWELIIVDDCSTDETEKIVSYFKDSRIKFFKNSNNLGAALTRNKALRKAEGRWIAFLDSDDIWQPSKLEKQLEFMIKNGYSFSYHNFEKIDESSQSLRVKVSGPAIVTRKMMYNYGYPGCLTFMYDAEKMGLIQVKDIKKNNDYAILLQLCKKFDCYLLDENLASYRIRKKSISHDKISKKLRSHYDLFRICDEQPPLKSLWFAVFNMYYGILKKIKYEKQF